MTSELAPRPTKMFGARHIQALMLFVAMVLAFSMRVNLSVAIVAMTSNQNNDVMTFDWSAQIQSVILSSFFWGYVILQIPGGELAGKYGGKILLLLSLSFNGIFTLMIPFGAQYGGWKLVCACRVGQGLLQGFIYPSVHNLIGKWVPLEEKGRLNTFIYAGAQLGTALEMLVAGLLAGSKWGWPSIFYSLGILSLVWTVVYYFVGANSPQTSTIISKEEKQYIETSLGHVEGAKKRATPWRYILTSLPFWALVVAHCGQNWGFWTLLTEMPTYMSKVLHVDIKANGAMSALPYLAMYFLSFPVGIMTDYAIKKKWVTVTQSRKISNTMAHWGPAIALIGLSYSPAGNVTVAVILLTVTVALNAGQFTGYLVVHIDMAPNFAGSLMGVTNCIANIISIIAPLTVGLILDDEENASEWKIVFFLSSGIYFICNLFFIIFATSERQAYNDLPDEDIEDNYYKQNSAHSGTSEKI